MLSLSALIRTMKLVFLPASTDPGQAPGAVVPAAAAPAQGKAEEPKAKGPLNSLSGSFFGWRRIYKGFFWVIYG